MTTSQFLFTANFPTLTDTQIEGGITAVEATWLGVTTDLWSTLPSTQQLAKQLLCENYLVGWWLANLYPNSVTGIVSNGGIPVESKSIGDVALTFSQNKAGLGLEQLKTNTFGEQAYQMIVSAGEMYLVYG